MNASLKTVLIRVIRAYKDNNILIRSLYFSPDSHWRCAMLSTQRKLQSAIRQTLPYPQTITGSYKSVRQTGQAMPFRRNRKQWYQSIWRKRRHTESRVSADANMRGFGSIHFPDSYFFASTLRFIIHISDQSHYYNQQNKA